MLTSICLVPTPCSIFLSSNPRWTLPPVSRLVKQQLQVLFSSTELRRGDKVGGIISITFFKWEGGNDRNFIPFQIEMPTSYPPKKRKKSWNGFHFRLIYFARREKERERERERVSAKLLVARALRIFCRWGWNSRWGKWQVITETGFEARDYLSRGSGLPVQNLKIQKFEFFLF